MSAEILCNRVSLDEVLSCEAGVEGGKGLRISIFPKVLLDASGLSLRKWKFISPDRHLTRTTSILHTTAFGASLFSLVGLQYSYHALEVWLCPLEVQLRRPPLYQDHGPQSYCILLKSFDLQMIPCR